MNGTSFLPSTKSPLSGICETSWFDPEGDCINEIFGIPLTGPVPFVIGAGILLAAGAIWRAVTKKNDGS